MKLQNLNKSDLRLKMERISNFCEIQGDLQNFENEFFKFCDEIYALISNAREFLSYDGEAYELSYTDPDSDPADLLGERPELDYDELKCDIYDAYFTLKGVLRRDELFNSDKTLIIAYKSVLNFINDLITLD